MQMQINIRYSTAVSELRPDLLRSYDGYKLIAHQGHLKYTHLLMDVVHNQQ